MQVQPEVECVAWNQQPIMTSLQHLVRRNSSLLLFALNANIENVTAAQYHVAIVGSGGVASIFGGSLQNYIHVTVGVDHSSSIFNIVLQSNAYLAVQFLH